MDTWAELAIGGGVIFLLLFYSLLTVVVSSNYRHANRAERMNEWLDEVENRVIGKK